MAVVKSLLRVASFQFSQNPAAMLSFINNELVTENDASMFVTLFIGLINDTTGRMLYASAGHPPPAVVTAEGAAILDTIPALPIGIFPEAAYQNREAFLKSGEFVLLYTDGVTEERNDRQDFFTLEKMQNILETTDPKGAENFCTFMLDRLADFRGEQQQHDDIAMVVLGMP